MNPDEYLNDPRPTCPGCGRPNATVRLRFDPLLAELGYEVALFRACDDCVHERKMEI